MFAVVFALSLQHPAFAFSSLLQQVFPLAHFFFFPLSAIATPVTIKNAVANKSTFFMIIFFLLSLFTNVKIREKLQQTYQ